MNVSSSTASALRDGYKEDPCFIFVTHAACIEVHIVRVAYTAQAHPMFKL